MSARTPGVKDRDFAVIKTGNNAWSILVEVGFISNSNNANKLNTLTKRNTAGQAIASGIKKFVDTLPNKY